MSTLKPVLSPRDLGRAIGVSESSVKRWVDEGAIPASRTAGGHRRIATVDAIQFIRRGQVPLVEPRILGLDGLESVELPHSTAQRNELAFDQLRRGDAAGFRASVVSLYLSGDGVADICDGPIRDALERIGEMHATDPEGILIEHRATDICLQGVMQLRLLLPECRTDRFAVGGAAPGDIYLLPSIMVATVLQELGYSTTNLGPNTPIASLRQACSMQEPSLVWVSVSVAKEPRRTTAALEELADELESRGRLLLLGGRDASSIALRTRPTVLRASSLTEVAAFIRGMHTEIRR